MAVKIGISGALTYGAAGSFFGSEIQFNAAVGPNYLASSTTLLAASLPCWVLITVPLTGVVSSQYSPDAGVTWRATSNALLYCDGFSTRLFNTGGAGANVFLVPIKQAS